ncbi:hypothetical protein LCGC14_0994540 [marine sediment metagenome]|uniref:Uncharacterized protein n=1 Tax=marine sediment metagenome TaxID=412755 RepID=A0A0F9RB69_9ZZZZ
MSDTEMNEAVDRIYEELMVLTAKPPERLCPLCGEKLDEIVTSQRVTFLRTLEGPWVKDTIDTLEIALCSMCNGHLSPEQLDELGVPNEIR